DKSPDVFVSMSQKLKDEGNRLFQSRNYHGALIKYDKAIQLLPTDHIDVSYLRSNMAECYMQMGISEYPSAIKECNHALEVVPTYSKALLKRARCHEALNELELALRDVRTVLKTEPSNLMAHEIEQRLRKTFERQGSRLIEVPVDLVPLPEYADRIKGKMDLSSSKIQIDEKNAEDKLVVEEERISSSSEEGPRKTMKLVNGEDIRWARVPIQSSIMKLREIISDHFPCLKAFLVKYKDQEGDLVTMTSTEDLRLAEASTQQVVSSSMKLHIFEVNPDQDPLLQKLKRDHQHGSKQTRRNAVRKEGAESSICLNDWIIQFAQFFKSYVGFDIDAPIDIHEVGIKIYSEAMEETVTSEEAQELFTLASDKFQEMAALALFNWGNVHMSRARKRIIHFDDDLARESLLEKLKNGYDWSQNEFSKAGERYEEALQIQPDFYEAVLALGQQEFEKAKLSWYFAAATVSNIEQWSSDEVLLLYNSAEENMEKGMQMWNQREQRRGMQHSESKKIESLLKRMNLDTSHLAASRDEADEQRANVTSQIYVLWGTILYERSIMEFKLGLPVWNECLDTAIAKFELAGASHTDISVMIKNHCSNGTGLEGVGFNIDEIVQAWNEMYDAKKWENRRISSFRLEPLLRRRVSKLYYDLQ
ncbi:hypothetical protein M569_10837, partial [Genlisea aurea]